MRLTSYKILYHMASRVTYQNISPEVARNPWRVMSPDAEGREVTDITRRGFRVTSGLIFLYSRPKRYVIYVIRHLK